METRPTLFISYSHDNPEHISWVKKLAYDLRVHGGVNVLLDQWSVRLGGSLKDFMENDLSLSRMVLCVCSEGYFQKANNENTGVGAELKRLTQISESKGLDHVIPIVRNNPDLKLPSLFSDNNAKYISFEIDEERNSKYKELLDRIWHEDLRKIPQIGPNPYSDGNVTDLEIAVSIEATKYSNPSFEGRATLNVEHNNGQYTIGTGEYTFITRWSRAGKMSVHAYNYSQQIKHVGYVPNRSEFPKSVNHILEIYNPASFSSRSRTPEIGNIIIWVNKWGKFAATRIEEINDNTNNRPEILVFSYKIYEGNL